MISKKSVDLTLTTMAIAALVLGVLVVSFILLTGGFQRFSKAINSCEQSGGECVSKAQCENPRFDYECPTDKVCCIATKALV